MQAPPFTKKEVKKSKLLVISIAIILIFLFIFALISYGNKDKTTIGFSVLDSSEQSSKQETDAFLRVGSDRSTSAATKSKSNLQFKNIEIKTDMELQSYSIPVNGLNIRIEAEQLVIVSSDMDITISLNTPMELKEFKGNIVWEDSKLMLQGGLSEYLADYVKINWKDPKDLSLRIEKGSVKIGDVIINELNGIASGKIEVSSKMTLNLDKDVISIKDYKGIFESYVDNNINTIKLDGKIAEFELKTQKFDVGIK